MLRFQSLARLSGSCVGLLLGSGAFAGDPSYWEAPPHQRPYVTRGFASDGTLPAVNKGLGLLTAKRYVDPTYPVGPATPGCAAPTINPATRTPMRSSGLVLVPRSR